MSSEEYSSGDSYGESDVDEWVPSDISISGSDAGEVNTAEILTIESVLRDQRNDLPVVSMIHLPNFKVVVGSTWRGLVMIFRFYGNKTADNPQGFVKNEETFVCHNSYPVTGLVKWGGDGFLSCGEDGSVIHHKLVIDNVDQSSISTKQIRIYEERGKAFLKMMRLSSDQFLLSLQNHFGDETQGKVKIISFSTSKEVRSISDIHCDFSTMFRLSTKFENSFYYLKIPHEDCYTEEKSVNLYSLGGDEQYTLFEGNRINNFSVYLDEFGDENIVVSSDTQIHFVRATLNESSNRCFRSITSLCLDVQCTFVYKNRFLFYSLEKSGFLVLYDIFLEEEVFTKRIHNRSVNNISLFEENEEKEMKCIQSSSSSDDEKNNDVRLLTSGGDCSIKVIKIEGSRFTGENRGGLLERRDILERIEFLKSSLFDDVDDDDDVFVGDVVVSIRMGGEKKFLVFNFLLM